MLSSCRNIETISKNVSGLTPVNLLNSVASNFFIFMYFFIFCLSRDIRFYTKKFRLRKMSNEIVTKLMKEEFQNDDVWSQFTCAISQEPIHLPIRTPGGQVFDYNSLIEAA